MDKKTEIEKIIKWEWKKRKCPFCGFKDGKPFHVMHHAISRHYDEYYKEYDLISRLNTFIQSLLTQQHTKDIEEFREMVGEDEDVDQDFDTQEELDKYVDNMDARNEFRHQLLSELNKLDVKI